MLRMQQHMRLMGHRLSKEITVDLPDIRVFMGIAQFCFCVQIIELSASRKRQLLSVVDRLGAPASTADLRTERSPPRWIGSPPPPTQPPGQAMTSTKS